MREIKFRVWDGKQMKVQGNMHDEATDIFWNWYETHKCSFPMQFTGLKDKKGKEIFEGDIVKCNRDEERKDLIRIVIWDMQSFKLSRVLKFNHNTSFGRLAADLCWIEWYSNFEVIGNIYENGELLK